ncbi:hypothetical protein, partial [Lampropedia puyangensis]|uniref:hypothetical protein n=1 Tax=Lampropedia puyangensis TaxID=1330072 RepID=UPI001B85D367
MLRLGLYSNRLSKGSSDGNALSTEAVLIRVGLRHLWLATVSLPTAQQAGELVQEEINQISDQDSVLESGYERPMNETQIKPL